MNPIRAATLTVADAQAAAGRYAQWFDYRLVGSGRIEADLAHSWGAPATAGARYAILRPASGVRADIRLVEGPPVPGYRPLRTFGWSAIELCVQDVLATHERLTASPFRVIGPPKRIDGLPQIHPMQVEGPDGEIVYLTEVKLGAPGSGLPTATVPVDTIFIVVAACADMAASAQWFGDQLGVPVADTVEIPYSMLARSFGLPSTQLHRLTTASRDGDIFIEFDQYPPAAVRRPSCDGFLAPGVALCTFRHANLDAVRGPWLASPVARHGPPYDGARTGTLVSPEGLLIELVEATEAS